MARASDCTLSLHCKWQRDRKYVWKQYGLFSRQLVLTESMSSWIVLFFSIAPGFQMILVLVDKSFLWKWYQTCLENIFCRSLSNPLLVVRNVAPQIKWLSCMFTSIFGDISMTIQAETLLKGEGWRCPFTQERAGVIHQPGCCPFSTAVPSFLLLTTPLHLGPPLPSLTSSINVPLFVILLNAFQILEFIKHSWLKQAEETCKYLYWSATTLRPVTGFNIVNPLWQCCIFTHQPQHSNQFPVLMLVNT